MKDLPNITLSYTYFPSKGGKPVAEATSATKPSANKSVTSRAETS